MKYVMAIIRQREAEEKLPVIRIEIDYELVTLHDALLADDQVQIIKTKERLNQLRLELIKIEEIRNK